MNLTDWAKTWVKSQESKMIKLDLPMHRSRYYHELERFIPGIYFLFIKDTDTCVYVGETKRCIYGRLYNHRKSMNDPAWPVEKTGEVFEEAGILDEEFTVYYIPSDQLEVENKAELTFAQDTFIMAYKPIGNWKKSGSKNVG